MPHGISLHIALKNSNSYYLLWDSSINQPASTTTGPSCKPAHHIIITPLQQALFHATSWASPASLMHFSQSPRLYQVHLLQLSFNEDSSLSNTWQATQNPCTSFYARNQLLARNNTSKTQHTHRSISAPHQRCSSDSQRIWKWITTLLALILITDHDAFLTTSVLLPSPLSARLP